MGPAFDDRHHGQSTEPLPHSTQLIRLLARSVDILASEFDVVEVTQQLIEACTEMAGAAAAGLLLADQRGDLQVLASTTEQPSLLSLLQLEAADGPSLLAYRSKNPATVPDLRSARHIWPKFTLVALDAGYRSTCALPLRLHRDSIGALTLFGASAGALGAMATRVGQLLADIAAVGIAHHVLLAQVTTVHAQLPTALHSRIAIEQAKGVLAERGGQDMDQTLQLMRAHARSTGRRLADIAADIVDGRLGVDDMRAAVTD